jgi:protein involved in polysaccharide export with SLBB domain
MLGEYWMKIIIQSFLLIIFSNIFLNAQILEPGDGVRIRFLNIDEKISGDYFIQQKSELQLPFIGILQTKNRDYNNIKAEINTKYDSLYREVELTILPLFRISILGEVRTPGVYYVTGVEKLLDVIALAGGETADSDMSEIFVERKNEKFVFDAEKLLIDSGDKQDFYLKSGDRVFVSRKWGTARNTGLIFTAAGLIIAIIAVVIK